MKALVVYESLWGNTEAIARAVAEGIGDGAVAMTTSEATPEVVSSADLVVAGAALIAFSLPTEQMRAQAASEAKAPPADASKPAMRDWLETLQPGSGTSAAFETGFKWSPGSAKGKIATALEGLGYKRADKPQRFRVAGRYGPLKEGEIDRARAWGKKLAQGS